MNKIITFLFIIISSFCKASAVNRTVYFDSGKSQIGLSDKRWIDSLSSILNSAVTYSIDIKSYCDADGSEESNLILAKARSANVQKNFINNKLDEKFIVINSFGENNPVADNNTKQGKAKNRRVEIVITYQLTSMNGQRENDKNDNSSGTKESVHPATGLSSEKLEAGKILILQNLNFEGGTPVLRPESEPTLKDLLKIMKDNPSLEIEIGGHVCCGPDMPLSIMRAQRVYNYLKGYGIDPKRMSYKGYSFDKPIAAETTEEGRVKNRRVEITILKIDN
jgi:outer membrane protein OmpA-like peptidoglycan-associated protein